MKLIIAEKLEKERHEKLERERHKKPKNDLMEIEEEKPKI